MKAGDKPVRMPSKQTAAKTAGPADEVKPPSRPGQCREYMRRRLMRDFPGIVGGFIEGAKSGSCQHVKLATEFLEPRRRAPQARKGNRTLKKLVEEMRQIE